MAYFRNGFNGNSGSIASDPIYIIKNGIIQDGYSFTKGNSLTFTEKDGELLVEAATTSNTYKRIMILDKTIHDIANSLPNLENKFLLLRGTGKKDSSNSHISFNIQFAATNIANSSNTRHDYLNAYSIEQDNLFAFEGGGSGNNPGDTIDVVGSEENIELGNDINQHYIDYVLNLKTLTLKRGTSFPYFCILVKSGGFITIKDLAIVEMPISYPV